MKQDEQLIKMTFRGFTAKMTVNYLMTFLGSIVDGIVISRFLGLTAMAAYQLTLPVVLLNIMLSMVFSIGVQNNCGKCLGAGRLQDASGYFSVAVLTLMPIALLWAVCIGVFAEPLALFLGSSGEMSAMSADYLRGLSPGLAMMLFMPLLSSLLFLEGKAKYAMLAIVCQVTVNVVGDFSNALFLHWGMMGMGLATSLCVAASLCVVLFARFKYAGAIRFSRANLQMRWLRPIVTVGLPSALDRLFKTAQMFLVNHVLLAVATSTALAAYADLNALNNLLNPLVIGISTSCLTMAGVFFGEQDKDSLHILLGQAVRSALKTGLLIAVLATAGAPLLIMLFVSPADAAYETAVRSLRIYVWFYPLYALNRVLQSYYLGCNAVRMSYLISTLENLLFICLSVVVLGHWFGADGVWLGFIVGELLTLLVTAVVIAVMKHRMPRTISDYSYLPKHFDSAAACTYNCSATTMEEVLEISRTAEQFMLSHNANGAQAMLVCLSIEEMGGNIIRWGFTDGKKHSIDFRLVGTDGWTLRIRDNCGRFDPVNWLKLHADEDKTRNMGIRTVCAIASDVSYANTLGMNYLFVKMKKMN